MTTEHDHDPVDIGRNWPNVFTPATLAEWWACSERHVRNLIDGGELPAFRLGGKLWRITPEAVRTFECQSGASPDCEANAASPGQTPPSLAEDGVIDLERQMQKRRPASPRLDTRSSLARAERR
jgi:excisionase family DNA binding protein